MAEFRKIINPRQTVLVSCRAEAEILGKETVKNNLITLDWHIPLSFDPELYGIAVGKTRFSCELIQKSGVFCINFMPYSLAKEVLFCGRISGKHTDKFKESGLSMEECEKIDCGRVAEAAAFLECEIVEEVETGDHAFFIGRVVNSGVKKHAKRLLHLSKDEFTTSEK